MSRTHTLPPSFSSPALLNVDSHGRPQQLNAYALDFYKHGQSQVLVDVNGLTKDEVLDRLRSWTLLLANVHRTLRTLATAQAKADAREKAKREGKSGQALVQAVEKASHRSKVVWAMGHLRHRFAEKFVAKFDHLED